MKQITGDFWEEAPNYDVLCVTTNGIVKQDGRLVMGKGIAKDFRDRYNELDYNLGNLVVKNGNNCYLINWRSGLYTRLIASIPTKHDWRDPSDIELIKRSVKELVKKVDNYYEDGDYIRNILMTRLGCGNGGLTWDYVCPIIEPMLDDRFTVIHK